MEPENTAVEGEGKMINENRGAFIESTKAVNDSEEIKKAAQNTRIATADTLSEEETRKLLSEYIVRTGKTQARIAKEMNISVAQISQFIGSTYKTPQKFIDKFTVYLELERKKENSTKKPGFCCTSVCGRMMDLMTYSHIQQTLGLIYGDAGAGKTMAIKEYKKQNPDTAVIITAASYASSMISIAEMIAEELHIQEKIARKIYSEAVRKLRGSRKIVIVDEAQHLTHGAIEALRSLGDESEIGMVFAGNDAIYQKMWGGKQKSYAQFFSRIGSSLHVLTSQITREDIELLFKENYLSPDVITLLLEISHSYHGLRGAVFTFINTATTAPSVTAQSIARTARKMNIG